MHWPAFEQTHLCEFVENFGGASHQLKLARRIEDFSSRAGGSDVKILFKQKHKRACSQAIHLLQLEPVKLTFKSR